MDEHPQCASAATTERLSLVAYPRVYLALEDAFAARRPFSLIRLGDGESAVLGYPEAVHAVRHARWMQNFFGPAVLSESDSARLRAGVEAAIAGADVVGMQRERFLDPQRAAAEALDLGASARPTEEDLHAINVLERRLLHHFAAPHLHASQLLTDANVHIHMHRTGLLVDLIRRSKAVSIISGNADVAARLAAIFGGTTFELVHVPEEYKWSPDRGRWNQREPHFPVVLDRVVESIRAGRMHYPVLIGAGPCGKIYCDEVRRAGGMALDIGSILDLWCGRMTRSYMMRELRVVVPG